VVDSLKGSDWWLESAWPRTAD